jgi:uncharacterized protein (DUF934 family)
MTMNIILDKKIVADTWVHLAEGEPLPATGNLIVPLSFWVKERDAVANRIGKTGVWLKGPDDPSQLDVVRDLTRLPLIAVEFAQFVDGRGYSIGRLLRERYGFTGELRAFGDVFRDQIPYLARCGFNAFVLKEGKSLEDALHAFDDFSDAYQNAVDQPVPYYRRRLAAVADVVANTVAP